MLMVKSLPVESNHTWATFLGTSLMVSRALLSELYTTAPLDYDNGKMMVRTTARVFFVERRSEVHTQGIT